MLSPKVIINKTRAVSAFQKELNHIGLTKEEVKSLSRSYKENLSISSLIKMSKSKKTHTENSS